MTRPRVNPAQARRQLGWAAAGLLVGVAASALGYALVGGIITVASMLGAAYALHRFGRSGPDPGATVPAPSKAGKELRRGR